MLHHLDYWELARGLIHNNLSEQERSLAMELISKEPEFLEVLKREIALHKQFAALKAELPAPAQRRVYAEVTGRKGQELYKIVLHKVLEYTLPSLFQPIRQLFERSVFAGE